MPILTLLTTGIKCIGSRREGLMHKNEDGRKMECSRTEDHLYLLIFLLKARYTAIENKKTIVLAFRILEIQSIKAKNWKHYFMSFSNTLNIILYVFRLVFF